MTILFHRKATQSCCLPLVSALVTAGLTLSVSSAQSPSFVCTLVDTKGKPLRKVNVRLVQFGAGGLPQGTLYAKSDKKGVSEFKDLTPSSSTTYQIDAQLKDYVSLTLVVNPGKETAITRTLLSQKEFDQRERKANKALEEGRYDEAIEAFKRLTGLYPEDAVLHDNLARCYAGKLDRKSALAEAEIAAELDPDRFASTRGELEQHILHKLGGQALHTFDLDLAEIHFTALKELNPESAVAYEGLALAYGHQGKAKQALEAINRAVELDPDNTELRKIQEVIKAAAP